MYGACFIRGQAQKEQQMLSEWFGFYSETVFELLDSI